MLTLNVLCIIAVAITILLVRSEVRRYMGARLEGAAGDFEKRRFTRRMLVAGILTIVLAMTYFGYVNKEYFIGRPWFFAMYWISCLFLALLLILLSLLDARAILKHSLKRYIDEEAESERLERFLNKDREKIS